jgi:hypothetical protein
VSWTTVHPQPEGWVGPQSELLPLSPASWPVVVGLPLLPPKLPLLLLLPPKLSLLLLPPKPPLDDPLLPPEELPLPELLPLTEPLLLPLAEPLLLPELLLLEPPPELEPVVPLELPEPLPLLEPPMLSSAPFGVPQPVGPSQPVPAVQRDEGEQVPLLPLVTSKKLPVFIQMYDGAVLTCITVNAPAMIGEAALVPPTCCQPPPLESEQ